MIAEAAHGLENLAQTLFVGDVITNEIGLAHGVSGGGAACRRRDAKR